LKSKVRTAFCGSAILAKWREWIDPSHPTYLLKNYSLFFHNRSFPGTENPADVRFLVGDFRPIFAVQHSLPELVQSYRMRHRRST